jgi:hypothetical protein
LAAIGWESTTLQRTHDIMCAIKAMAIAVPLGWRKEVDFVGYSVLSRCEGFHGFSRVFTDFHRRDVLHGRCCASRRLACCGCHQMLTADVAVCVQHQGLVLLIPFIDGSLWLVTGCGTAG